MSDNWRGKVAAGSTAAVLAIGALGAKAAHLGPFADDIVRNADIAAMSVLAFGDNAAAMRNGTLLEKQALEVACSLFTSLATTGEPPLGWRTFRGALADRFGVSTSGSYFNTKVDQLEVTAELVQRQPRLAVKYVAYCF